MAAFPLFCAVSPSFRSGSCFRYSMTLPEVATISPLFDQTAKRTVRLTNKNSPLASQPKRCVLMRCVVGALMSVSLKTFLAKG